MKEETLRGKRQYYIQMGRENYYYGEEDIKEFLRKELLLICDMAEGFINFKEFKEERLKLTGENK